MKTKTINKIITKKNRAALSAGLMLLIVLSFAGCSAPSELSVIISETADSLVYADAFGEHVRIKKKPGRVIALSSSFADLWYLAGGTIIARTDDTTNLPEEALEAQTVGPIISPSVEKIVSLKPDLVILGKFSAHRKVKQILRENGFAAVSMNYYNYDDFTKILDFFLRLTGREDIRLNVVKKITGQVNEIIARCRSGKKSRVIMLSVSPAAIHCQTDRGLVGDMLCRLGAVNPVQSPFRGESTQVPVSIEKVLQINPDAIFISFHGDIEKCRIRLERDCLSTPTWGALDAVQKNRFFFLPRELFLHRPNHRYPEAFRILAGHLYPEVFH